MLKRVVQIVTAGLQMVKKHLALAFLTMASKGVDERSSLLSDGLCVAHKSKSAKITNTFVKSDQMM
jgi:hypothetical protein